MRSIFHVDMDAFFVSVEELYDPSLIGKPVVAGGASDQRGVVSAASYAARKFGVHSAMPLRTAYQLCPQATFVEGHPERYRKYSNLVEMASIDEAYLDMTGTERLHGPPLLAAHKLHNAIKAATGLNNSIGAGSSRLLAKVCSDQAKPHGIVWIPPGAEAAFLAPLDVRKIPGVGKVTEQKLHRLGIRQVGDMAALEPKFLAEHFGQWGLALGGKRKGLDSGGWFQGEIGEGQDPKSISHEHTFSVDTADADALEAALAHLSDSATHWPSRLSAATKPPSTRSRSIRFSPSPAGRRGIVKPSSTPSFPFTNHSVIPGRRYSIRFTLAYIDAAPETATACPSGPQLQGALSGCTAKPFPSNRASHPW
jgi:DNA polymerase IV